MADPDTKSPIKNQSNTDSKDTKDNGSEAGKVGVKKSDDAKKDSQERQKEALVAREKANIARVKATEAELSQEEKEALQAERDADDARAKAADAAYTEEEARYAEDHTVGDAKVLAPVDPALSAGHHHAQKFSNDPANPKSTKAEHDDPEQQTSQLFRWSADIRDYVTTHVHPELVGDYLRAGWSTVRAAV